jgi:hypothetical protein
MRNINCSDTAPLPRHNSFKVRPLERKGQKKQKKITMALNIRIDLLKKGISVEQKDQLDLEAPKFTTRGMYACESDGQVQ